MADWDLREQVLIASWAHLGHEFRPVANGAACCLKCDILVHVRKRALAAAGEFVWVLGENPAVIRRCRP